MDTIWRGRWYFEASAEDFRRRESTEILGQLVVRHPFDVNAKQRDAWLHQIDSMKLLASEVPRDGSVRHSKRQELCAMLPWKRDYE